MLNNMIECLILDELVIDPTSHMGFVKVIYSTFLFLFLTLLIEYYEKRNLSVIKGTVSQKITGVKSGINR